MVPERLRALGASRPALMRQFLTVLLVQTILSFPAHSAMSRDIEVTVRSAGDNTSIVTLRSEISAGEETVWQILTDYDHHVGVLPYMTVSEVVGQDADSRVVRQEGAIDILFWTFTLCVRQRVWEDPPFHMHFAAFEGDFETLRGDFKLSIPTVDEKRTRLDCEFTVKPKRRVPDWAVRLAARVYLKRMVRALGAKAEERGP